MLGAAAVFPVAEPADATSPGTRSCSFANAPATTVIDGLVFGVFAGVVMFDAVAVHEPTVLSVKLMVFVPATIAAFAGNPAFTSLDVIPTVFALAATFTTA